MEQKAYERLREPLLPSNEDATVGATMAKIIISDEYETETTIHEGQTPCEFEPIIYTDPDTSNDYVGMKLSETINFIDTEFTEGTQGLINSVDFGTSQYGPAYPDGTFDSALFQLYYAGGTGGPLIEQYQAYSIIGGSSADAFTIWFSEQ